MLNISFCSVIYNIKKQFTIIHYSTITNVPEEDAMSTFQTWGLRATEIFKAEELRMNRIVVSGLFVYHKTPPSICDIRFDSHFGLVIEASRAYFYKQSPPSFHLVQSDGYIHICISTLYNISPLK